MKPTPHPVFSASVLVLALSALPASAATSVLFSENFNAITNNTELNTAGWFYRHGSNTSTYYPGPIAHSSGTMSGNVLRGGTGSSANAWVLKQWGGTTLTSVGDALSVTFDLSMVASASRFNVSFFEAGSTVITANSYSTGGVAGGSINPITGSTGYGYHHDFGAGTAGIVTTTVANTGFDTVAYKLSDTANIVGEVRNLTFSVKLVETGAQISLFQGAQQLSQWTDTSVSGSISFDTLKFWISSGNTTTANRALDNVVLSHTSAVPEPSSAAALAGLATLGLVATRRRRK